MGKLELLELIVVYLFSLLTLTLVVGGIAYFIADRGGGQKTEILRRILEIGTKFWAYFLFGLIFVGGIIILIAVIFFGYEI